MDINQAVASQIRAERASARLTMDQVVARTAISKSSLVRYEKGDREIPISVVAELAAVYGVGVRHIIGAAVTLAEAEVASAVQDPADTRVGTTGNVVEWSSPAHAPSQVRARGGRGTTGRHKP